jgi:hypothetical protein
LITGAVPTTGSKEDVAATEFCEQAVASIKARVI